MVIAERIAHRVLGREHQKAVVGHVQPELLAPVLVLLGRLVSSPAGAVELGARVDARSGRVAGVLAREGVAGAADGDGRDGGHEGGGGGKEEDGEGAEGDHFVWYVVLEVGRYIYII